MQKWKALGGERKEEENQLWRISIPLTLNATIEAIWKYLIPDEPLFHNFCISRVLPRDTGY